MSEQVKKFHPTNIVVMNGKLYAKSINDAIANGKNVGGKHVLSYALSQETKLAQKDANGYYPVEKKEDVFLKHWFDSRNAAQQWADGIFAGKGSADVVVFGRYEQRAHGEGAEKKWYKDIVPTRVLSIGQHDRENVQYWAQRFAKDILALAGSNERADATPVAPVERVETVSSNNNVAIINDDLPF